MASLSARSDARSQCLVFDVVPRVPLTDDVGVVKDKYDFIKNHSFDSVKSSVTDIFHDFSIASSYNI
jgi:hypothetical protein